MYIERDGKKFMLTADEVRKAYLEEQINLLLEDASEALAKHICIEDLEDDALAQKEFYLEYGVDHDAIFEPDSNFYLLPKLASMYRENRNCNIPETDAWQNACEILLNDLRMIQKKADELYLSAFSEIFVSKEEL